MKKKIKKNYWRSASVILIAGLLAITFLITGCGQKENTQAEKKEEKKVEKVAPGKNGATEEIVTEGLPKDFKELVGMVKEVNKDSITIEADKKSESFKINEDTFVQKEVAEENEKPVEGKIEDIKAGGYVSVVAKGEGVINICLLTEEDFKMFNKAGE
ncbi:hypothetical protein [Candidatus Oleimmundimicrobium sp.]|uniref:hypothetical protein n=1 Tax=Candidatus Oleimmundimicrobium sp. TaxID=3060597 RepID=UPI0027178F6D|nr:hypothetical protein [Candidatus Oleimmundimicrobium sp.]MDO8886670.1 hypothetical protein [Candidatus Oleimmundimicrobium sp.]